LVLSIGACDLRCRGESELGIAVESDSKPQVKGGVGVEVQRDGKTIAEATLPGEPRRTVEVEVQRTVCDALDLELERIVLVPADPPFHDVPRERVSIRITNGAERAVELDSGTDAAFLDERRTLVKADLHQSDWFMPLTLPAKSAAVVQIFVPEGAGKALRMVEVEASPADDPFSDCKVSDDLLGAPAVAATPAEAKAEAEASVEKTPPTG
jgi:hypothetical protein